MYFVSLYCITYAPEGNPSLSYFLPRIKTTKNYNPFRGMFGNVCQVQKEIFVIMRWIPVN